MIQLIDTIQRSIRTNWSLPALSDFKGTTMTYADTARRIAKMHILFRAAGIRHGDKVALCAKKLCRMGFGLSRHPHLWGCGGAYTS